MDQHREEHVFEPIFIEALQSFGSIPKGSTYKKTWESIEFPEGYEKPQKEEFETKHKELLNILYNKELRAERDRRLAATDWVTLKAYSTSTPVPEAWATYMQALRDLPANTEDPANPVWPVQPSP